MRFIVLCLPFFLCSCVSLFAPDFVQEEIKSSAEFKVKHGDSFHTLYGEKRDVAYVQVGKAGAPKIIFVHGSPGNWGAFIHQLDRPLLPQKALIISADRLGYGGSARGGVSKSLDEQSKALLKLLDLDDPKQPVILVGHSYGGPVVTKMAASGDPRIKSILILAGSVDPSLEETKWYQYPADWWILRWSLPEDLVTCNQEIMALKPELVTLGEEWKNIKARVNVIQGKLDDLVPPGNAEYIREKSKDLNPQIIYLENRDHFLQAYENDLIEKVLAEELAKIQP